MERTAGNNREIDLIANHFFLTRDDSLLDDIVLLCQPVIKVAVSKQFASFSVEDREEVIQNASMDIVRLLRNTKKSTNEWNWEPQKKYGFQFVPLFLSQVCHNFLCNEYRRLTSARMRFHLETEELDRNVVDPGDFIEEIIYKEIIDAFVQHLDQRDREIFLGRVGNIPFEEIATALGASSGKAVRARLRRIRQRLAKMPIYKALVSPSTDFNILGEGWTMSRNIDYVKVKRPDEIELVPGSSCEVGQYCLSVTNLAVVITKHRDTGRFDIKNILIDDPVENLHPEYGMVPVPEKTAQLLKSCWLRDRADEQQGKLRKPSCYCECVAKVFSDPKNFIDSDVGAVKILEKKGILDVKDKDVLKSIEEAPEQTKPDEKKPPKGKKAAKAKKPKGKKKKKKAPPKRKSAAPRTTKSFTNIIDRFADGEFTTRMDLIRACINTGSMTKGGIVATAMKCYPDVAKNALYTQLGTACRALRKRGIKIVVNDDGKVSARKK